MYTFIEFKLIQNFNAYLETQTTLVDNIKVKLGDIQCKFSDSIQLV
jgi:hypothetical protein